VSLRDLALAMITVSDNAATDLVYARVGQEAVELAGKTGTLPFVRNEAGVVTYPDGHRYAVAVFTRTESALDRDAAVDAATGRAARLAVDALRPA
jgi:beta-lactamase class A